MKDQQELKISFLTLEKELTITATASYPDGQPFSPYILATEVRHPDQFPSAQSLMQYIFLTAQKGNVNLFPELTVQYGFWLIKLVAGERNRLEIYELDEQNQFVRGFERALQYWNVQMQLCQAHNFPFNPAYLQQTAIINKKIFDPQQPVLGFRNVRDENMSGWVIISNQEDLLDRENAESMYLYDIILQRPQLIHFFGLPLDSAFYLDSQGYRVWSIAEND